MITITADAEDQFYWINGNRVQRNAAWERMQIFAQALANEKGEAVTIEGLEERVFATFVIIIAEPEV